MSGIQSPVDSQVVDTEWVGFHGGELEGKRPKALCPACREKLNQRAASRLPADGNRGADARAPLCFQCYRADLVRERALKAAGDIDTTSVERFQFVLPL